MSRQFAGPALGAALLLAAGFALADANPNARSTDVFDTANGAVVTGSSPGSACQANVITIDGPCVEPGHAFFADGALNSIGFVNFRTVAPVQLTSVRMFAGSDGAANGNRRAMNRFRVLADTNGDGTFETVAVDQAVDPDYSMIPGDADPLQNQFDLTVALATPITSRDWQLEVTQGVDQAQFDGVRVIELDGIGVLQLSASGVPATDTWARLALALGMLGLGFVAWRRLA